MKIPWKLLKWVIALVVLALAVAGIEILRFGGVFRSTEPRFAGNCRTIPLGGSAEDIHVDRQRGVAYLSLLERDRARRGETVDGTVMLLDLNLPEPAPRAAMTYEPQGFRPQGLSLLSMAPRPARLFVISHRPDGSHVVEIAEEGSAGGFTPKETIRSEHFVHPNAIAATGTRQFYLTNVAMSQGHWALARQALLRAGHSTLVYFDGDEARVEVSDLNFPAGLALSPDSSRLYVAETLARQLRIYRRNAGSGALALEETVELRTAPGNLNIDDDGVVWIAAHPKLLNVAAHLRDASRHSPTQVLRFDPRRRGDSRLTEIYVDDGLAISAGSTAAPWRDEFLIGALFDPKVLLCKLNP